MSKEAMKLALEALKQIDEAMPFPVAKFAQAALREALAEQPAIKQDLTPEQPAQQEKDWGAVGEAHIAAIKKSSKAMVEDAVVRAVHKVMAEFEAKSDERLMGQPAQQEPVAWADECRISLVTAIHFLASDYENALGVFRDDTEARRKAEGDIAYARKIAAKWNWNGTSPPAQRKPLTDEEIESINVKIESINVKFAGSRDLARLFARAIEAAHGIKGEKK